VEVTGLNPKGGIRYAYLCIFSHLNKKLEDFLNVLRPSWVLTAVNSLGNSGGLLASWDPNLYDLVASLTCGGDFINRTDA
jgi:hypothetical protein